VTAAPLIRLDQPFAIIRRGDAPVCEILTGRVVDVARVADIPLDGPAVLAVIPFRQIAERGFPVFDDAAPLRLLVAAERRSVPLADLLAALPADPPPFEGRGFDVDDEAYARQVSEVIEEEIGQGEGANFVLHRSYLGRVQAPPAEAVTAWLGALLRRERGAYWTYAVSLDGLAFAGASPERHVTVVDSVVTMNPISGTYRHPASGPDEAGMVSFLTDAKEVEELFMVVDEELKLMSALCPAGGRVIGPYLKPMSRVTHTEYLLEGVTDADPRDVVRQTMFAPTVTGAPMENACAVIKRREARPRGYYAGVMALFTPGEAGNWDVDSPIMIRTAYVDRAGKVSLPAGATLVRHSDPVAETAETRTKAAAMLAALGVDLPGGAARAGGADSAALAASPRVQATLRYRNERLAPFWLRQQGDDDAPPRAPLAGRSVVIVDAADNFSQMLAHQFRRLGAEVRVDSWSRYSPGPEDLVVPGPGPGDPAGSDPRVEGLRDVIVRALTTSRPLLAVCLSHQILARSLGLDLRRLGRPRQGEQLTDDLFGEPATLGYYNTFTAVAPLTPPPGLRLARRRGTDEVIGVLGDGFASLQGHPESALSTDGIDLLARLAPQILR
jgi:phenazine biosynthesis protein phzE